MRENRQLNSIMQKNWKQTEFLVFLMLCLVKSQQLKAIPYVFAERVVSLMKLSTNAHNDNTVKCEG